MKSMQIARPQSNHLRLAFFSDAPPGEIMRVWLGLKQACGNNAHKEIASSLTPQKSDQPNAARFYGLQADARRSALPVRPPAVNGGADHPLKLNQKAGL